MSKDLSQSVRACLAAGNDPYTCFERDVVEQREHMARSFAPAAPYDAQAAVTEFVLMQGAGPAMRERQLRHWAAAAYNPRPQLARGMELESTVNFLGDRFFRRVNLRDLPLQSAHVTPANVHLYSNTIMVFDSFDMALPYVPGNVAREINYLFYDQRLVNFEGRERYVQAASREVSSIVFHEYVHYDQQYGHPEIAKRAAAIKKSLLAASQEASLDIIGFSAQEAVKRFEDFFIHLERYDSELAKVLRNWPIPFERITANNTFTSKTAFRLLLSYAMVEWLKNPLQQLAAGPRIRAITESWKMERNMSMLQVGANTFPDEAEAQIWQEVARSSGLENYPNQREVFFMSIGEDAALPFETGSKHVEIPPALTEGFPSRPPTWFVAAQNFLNNRAVMGTLRGFELLGNALFVLDWAELFFIDPLEGRGREVGLTGKATLSTGASYAGTRALFTAEAASRVSWLKHAGLLGTAVITADASMQLVTDLADPYSNKKEVVTSVAQVGTGGAALGGAVALATGAVSGGVGTVIVGGGMAAASGLEILHAEFQEDRIAEQLHERLKRYQTEGGSRDFELRSFIVEHGSRTLDDDVLMELFANYVEKDALLHEPRLWRDPSFQGIRRRFLDELSGEGCLSYAGDEEAAYRMFLALCDSREAVKKVKAEMDYSDWQAFEELLDRWQISLHELDKEDWLS